VRSSTLLRMFRRVVCLFSWELVFSAACTCPAQQLPDPAFALDRSALVIAFTSERLCSWQNRLNLKDWKISLVFSRAAELKPNTSGHIHWEPELKTAVIQILDPADYHLPESEMLHDMEFTIVHELIHLSFGPALSDFRRTEANRREEEQAVNQVTDALLKLQRSSQSETCAAICWVPLSLSDQADGQSMQKKRLAH